MTETLLDSETCEMFVCPNVRREQHSCPISVIKKTHFLHVLNFDPTMIMYVTHESLFDGDGTTEMGMNWS